MQLMGFTLGFLISASVAVAETCWLSASKEVAGDCDAQTCRWTFALGDTTSRQFFDLLRQDVEDCPNLIAAEQDVGVNHPDYYDAWLFRFDHAEVSVSIKDKTAFGETYVVMRSTPAN